MPAFDVLSYGTIGLDYVIRVPDWPQPAKGVHASEEREYLGGKATNVAVFLASWDLQVAVSGNVLGDDLIGERILARLADHPNISTRYVKRIEGERSMYCRILVNPDGERAIIGINVDQSAQTQPTNRMVGDARLLTLDLYGGEERIEAAHLAYESGVPVVIGDLRQVNHPVLPYTAVAIASAEEIRIDYPSRSMASIVEAIKSVGPRDVIITDGPAAVHVFPANGEPAQIAPPPVEVVDTTGAGDAFRAGVVYGYLAEWSLADCAAFGVAAGSLNVQQNGAASQPPDVATVRGLANQLARK